MKRFLNFKNVTAGLWVVFVAFIATLVICSTSCSANDNTPLTKQELITNVMNGEKQKTDTIDIEFGLIVSILYDPYYDKCIIQYDDSDIIDRDFVIEIAADSLYWEEMAELNINCSNDVLIELLNDLELYNQYKDIAITNKDSKYFDKAFQIEDSYKLLEHKIEVYNGIQFSYELVKL